MLRIRLLLLEIVEIRLLILRMASLPSEFGGHMAVPGIVIYRQGLTLCAAESSAEAHVQPELRNYRRHSCKTGFMPEK
jgi:hypothetical protein